MYEQKKHLKEKKTIAKSGSLLETFKQNLLAFSDAIRGRDLGSHEVNNVAEWPSKQIDACIKIAVTHLLDDRLGNKGTVAWQYREHIA